MGELNLTTDELTVLVEALDAWVRGDKSGELLGDLMTGMLPKEETREHAADQMQKIKAEGQEKERNRKERAILLQAKLLQMRDAITAGVLLSQP